ncbi:MAG: hypothetical protein J6C59_05150 [Muribaculaceae bacterium]|nr:hypothetical protein [Muribaculaceae bacterium]
MANDKKKRTFNLDKGEKRTFNLAKEDDEEIDVVVPEQQPEPPESLTGQIEEDSGMDQPKKPNRKGVYAILAVCVLAAIGLLIWWLIPSDRTETLEPDSEGIADTATAPADTAREPENTIPQDAAPADEASPSASENIPAQENTPATSAPAEAPSGSIDEQAQKAIQGVYGNGRTRRDNLGSTYREVQDRVNELLKK